MQRRMTYSAALAVLAGLAGASLARGAVSAAVDVFEEVWDYRTGDIAAEQWHQQGQTMAQVHYPLSAAPRSNSAAYADADRQIIRAYGIAETVDPTNTVQFPHAPLPTHQTDRSLSQVSASFRNQLQVGAGSSGLAAGDPVQIQFQLRLDGQLRVGPVYSDPGSFSSWAEMSAGYRITDRSAPAQEGEATLLTFGLSAEAQKDASRPSFYYPKGVLSEFYQTSWSLLTNASDPLEDFIRYNPDSADYPTTPYAGTEPMLDTLWSIDTGLLTVQITTYVGATLDIEGNMDLLMQSRYNAPKAGGEFLNTFGVDFAPTADYQQISLTLESASVPEPTAVVFLVLGASALIARPRRCPR